MTAYLHKRLVVSLTLCAPILCVLSKAIADDVDCKGCHTTQATELASSIHSALQCNECHGGSNEYTMPAEQIARFKSAPAGERPPFDHGDSFKGRAERKDVPQLCGECHADIERMNAYGIRTDQLARYWTSIHGKTLRDKGDDRVAVCVDCHGVHDILKHAEPASRSNPFNVPDTCATCHADSELMSEYDLPVEVVDEYRMSVHGDLLFNQGDSGAPTCATCHGNHSAAPPGFASVGMVCGQCHQGAEEYFSESIHADLEDFKGCVQCHGGGEGRHFHLIERITKPSGVLIERYEHLLSTEPNPTPEQVSEAINSTPKEIMNRVLPTCLDCHDDIEEDESLPKLFTLIDAIASAERRFVETANRLDELGRGVLLVDNQRFEFQDAKTHLIGLAPLQHTLTNEKVDAKVKELQMVCDQVNEELDGLEQDLRRREQALIPIWFFSVVFSALLYVKFKQLKKTHVKPASARDRS